MIRSVNPVVYNSLNGDTDYIYAWSTIQNSPNEFIVRTRYFREGQENGSPDGILIFAAEERFPNEVIDGLFESLKPMIGSLPFSVMVEKGIELALFEHLRTHEKFGVPVDSKGWEIIS